MNRLIMCITAVVGLAAPSAFAGSDGIPVTIRVVNAVDQQPIPTAVIRHKDEADRHAVNANTGAFTTSVLYMPDGREVLFKKGDELTFEVSAPGYMNQEVTYEVRRRKNRFVVPLQVMETNSDPLEDPVIQFGRDRPRDGQPLN